MRFIQELGFRVRQGRLEAFQEWLADNEERLRRAYPEGTEYAGTYAVVYSDAGGGEFRMFERLDSYAALDRMAALGKDPSSEFSTIFHEYDTFIEPDPDAPHCQLLLKDAVDATLWDMPADQVPEPVGAGRR